MVPPPKHRKRKPFRITKNTPKNVAVEVVQVGGKTFTRTKRLKWH